MKNVLITILLLISTTVSAQIGIANTNPQATLDVAASNQATPANTDGILIPRVDAFPVTNPTVTQDAMLVYLTTTDGTDAPGFYYWNNATTTWLGFGGGTVGWELTGNAGTVNGTHFLGTTDAQDLDIRTNNIIHNRFTTNGQLEFLNTEGSVYIGENTGAADDLTNGIKENVFLGSFAGENITTGASSSIHGRYSTGVGYNAMNALTTGAANTAVGHNSSASMTTGLNNASVGLDALKNAIDADNNVAIGVDAIENITADNNTGVGYRALRGGTGTTGTGFNNTALGSGAGNRTTDGTNNVFVGYDADEFNTLGNQNVILGSDAGATTGSATTASGRVLIGYRAGRSATSADNVLMIENSSSVTPLIYGEFDNDILRVGGQLQIGSSDDTTAGAIYSFPVVDGTSGQVLTTDGLGDVTWQNGGVASAWDLTGNAGTVNGTNFLGTTDAVDLDIRTNNVIHNRFTTSGQLEFLNTGGSVRIGENAGALDDLSDNRNVLIGENTGVAMINAANNVAVGADALRNNISGSSNVALGRHTLQNNTTGEDNIAIGTSALRGSGADADRNVAIGYAAALPMTGDENVAIGYDVMSSGGGAGGSNTSVGSRSSNRLTTGSDNVAIGQRAEHFNQAGSNNTILGTNAGLAFGSVRSFSGRVLIGNGAGQSFDQDNLLAIENTTSTIPLIGGDFSTDRVGINLDPRTALTSTLTVGGDIEATGSLISGTTTYPDYVFENYFSGQSTIDSNYSFTPLNEAISFVKANGHLPNVKSYKEVKAEGMVLDVTKTSVKNLEKIEENFLYIAELKASNDTLTEEKELLKAQLTLIVNRLNALENNNK